jgi:hypothetical protein
MVHLQASRAVRVIEHPRATRSFLREHAVHADVLVQAALQLAHLRLTGAPALAYQPVSTRHFRHGRTEALRPATAPLLAFVRALHGGAPPASLAQSFQEAAVSLLTQQAECLQGQGIDRHLLALRRLSEELGVTADLFADPTLAKVTGPAPLCTSTLPGALADAPVAAAFFPDTEDGFGIAFHVTDAGTNLTVCSHPRQAGPFASAVELALDDLLAFLAGRGVDPRPPGTRVPPQGVEGMG